MKFGRTTEMFTPLIKGTALASDTACTDSIGKPARSREEEAWYERSLWDDVITHK